MYELLVLIFSFNLCTSSTLEVDLISVPERVEFGQQIKIFAHLRNFTKPLSSTMTMRMTTNTDSRDILNFPEILVSTPKGYCKVVSEPEEYRGMVFNPYCARSEGIFAITIRNVRKVAVLFFYSDDELREYVKNETKQENERKEYWLMPYFKPKGASLSKRSPELTDIQRECSLICKFRGGFKNAGMFTWKRLNSSRRLPNQSEIRNHSWLKGVEGNFYSESSLHFVAEPGDEGWYQCSIQYYPAAVGTFQSNIVRIGEKFFYKPIVDGMKMDKFLHKAKEEETGKFLHQAKTGETVTLKAFFLSNPIISSFQWAREGKTIVNSNASGYATKHNVAKLQSELNFIMGDNKGGSYTCMATNDGGEGRITFIVVGVESKNSSHLTSSARITAPTDVKLIGAVFGVSITLSYW